MPPPLEELLSEAIRTVIEELAYVAPRIFLTILALSLLAVAWRIARAYLGKLLKFAEADKLLEKVLGKPPPFSPTRAVLVAADVGIAVVAILLAINVLLPAELKATAIEWMLLLGRAASLILIAVVILSLFELLIKRVRVEAKLRSYLSLVSFLILTAFLIDVSAMSPEVKAALVWGLAQGIGISIAIFAAWFFFGDYIAEYLEKASRVRANSGEPEEASQA